MAINSICALLVYGTESPDKILNDRSVDTVHLNTNKLWNRKNGGNHRKRREQGIKGFMKPIKGSKKTVSC